MPFWQNTTPELKDLNPSGNPGTANRNPYSFGVATKSKSL
jgi:hypothetical protein